jgi:hypothetical protein
MTINLTEILTGILTLLGLLITTFLVPWLKAKIDEGKLTRLTYWIEVAVLAAEGDISGKKKGAERKQFVLDFLQDKGYDINLNDLEIQINSTVYDIINKLKETK